MDDLISSQAAIEAMGCISDSICEAEAVDALCELPTIDAEPVRHGKWIEEHCSECGQYVYHGDARNYCPNCGADMRGEE